MPAHWKPVSPEHGRRGKFAEKLRDAVQFYGVSPAEIADYAGVSRATIYAVLAGHRLPSAKLMTSMSYVMNFGSAKRVIRPIPARLSLRVLAEQRDRLEQEARRTAPPAAPPVQVGVVPEHREFAAALNAWVDEYRDEFPYYWPESDFEIGKGVSRGWLQRFLEARAIPSEVGLGSLIPDEKPGGMEDKRWNQCQEEHDQLHRLAFEARRARRAAQSVARSLQNGS